jgi:hypothetical protein
VTAANKSIPYIFIYSANLSKQQNNLYYYIPMCDGRAALKASRANITSPVACRVLHTARGWNACSTLSQRLERVLPPCHVRHHRCQNFSSIDIRLESEPPKRTKRKIKNKETWLQQNLHSLFSRAIVFCSILCIKAVLEFVF